MRRRRVETMESIVRRSKRERIAMRMSSLAVRSVLRAFERRRGGVRDSSRKEVNDGGG